MSRIMKLIAMTVAALVMSFGFVAVDTSVDVANNTEQVADAYGLRHFGYANGGHWMHCSSIPNYGNTCGYGHFHLSQNPKLCVVVTNAKRVRSAWGFWYVNQYTIINLRACT